MSRLKNHGSVPSLFGPEPQAKKLDKQPCWPDKPWQPGQIPLCSPGNVGSLCTVHGPLDQPAQPYGEFMGVQKPVNSHEGYSPVQIVDLEGHETKRNQK